MFILSLSTSSKVASVSLLENDNCLKELNIFNEKTHSENLMPLIDELLSSLNKKISDINLIAIDNGPGSFTGIRIGISTVKAIAEVLQIPIISCSSLEGLAYNIFKPTETICSLMDARNNQVYCGIFDSEYNLIDEYLADDIKNILPVLQKYNNISFVGDGAFIHKNLLIGNFCNDNEVHSKNIGICAYKKFKNGFLENSDSVLPLYLRKSQAERMKQGNA